jgi:hypothetical protein
LHTTVRLLTSPPSSTWLPLASMPDHTAVPPWGHSTSVASPVPTTTSGVIGGGDSVSPETSSSLHPAIAAIAAIAAHPTRHRKLDVEIIASLAHDGRRVVGIWGRRAIAASRAAPVSAMERGAPHSCRHFPGSTIRAPSRPASANARSR